MDANDQNDIIKKVKEANNDSGNTSGEEQTPETNDGSTDEIPNDNESNDIDLDENKTLYPKGWKEMDGIFMNPKKNNMFQPHSNDNLKESKNKDLSSLIKNSIFDKTYIVSKLQETFNQEDSMGEPTIPEPQVKPAIKPSPTREEPTRVPSRRDKPFLPMPEVTPDPKAKK